MLQRTDVKSHIGLFAADAAPAGYGPSQLHDAYGLPSDSGQGETVAVVEAYDDPDAASDLAVYRSQYGLPACTTGSGCFRKVNQQGQSSGYPPPDPGWAEEESLDIDMVSAICPDCHVLVVEATTQSFADLAASVDTAVRLGATYVSNSYGYPDSSSYASEEKSYDHPGVAITASAGDSGYGVSDPAGFPDVTAVGGTSLLPASNPRGWDEIVWTGTGSGCSVWAKPAWQAGTGCARRTDNDVAAVADPETGVAIYDSFGVGGWTVVGGTSVSSPVIASVYALGGRPAAGTYPASYLYASDSAFNDIVAGTNDLSGNCSPAYLCNGEPAYDGPTGWGTPAGVGAFEAPAQYVAMGDSYSSGEGNPPYDPGTNTSSDQCHRSGDGYPAMVTLPGQPVPVAQQAKDGGNDTFTFVACSGAETTGITADAVFNGAPPEQQWNSDNNTDWGHLQTPLPEGLQAAPANLSAQTTLVTLTVGGNDARFSDVLANCLRLAPKQKTDCISSDYHLTRTSLSGEPVDPEPLVDFEPQVIDHLQAHLEKTYDAIHDLAPNAEIIVAGYPLLFPANATASCTVGRVLAKTYSLSADDQNWLNQMGTMLNRVVSGAVTEVHGTGVDIHYLDPTSAFTGHALCSAQPWFYGLKALFLYPWGARVPNPASFHPNQAGQAAYAKLVNGCLDGSVPC